MAKYFSIILTGAIVIMTLGCGGESDERFKPPKGKEPKAPAQTVDRSGSPDSFLPSADGGGPDEDVDIFGNN